MKVLVLGLFAVLAASAQKVDVEFDKAADFSKFKTFGIRDGRLTSKNPMLNSDLIKKRIEADLQKALEGKGLTFMPSGASDLNVRYTLGTAQKRETETRSTGVRGRGIRTVRVPYTEGTLMIDLRDSEGKSLVWRAIAREERKEAAQIEGKLDDMVKKSIDKYPPKGKAKQE